jgi:Flp pilus assembly pilin Flp
MLAAAPIAIVAWQDSASAATAIEYGLIAAL